MLKFVVNPVLALHDPSDDHVQEKWQVRNALILAIDGDRILGYVYSYWARWRYR